MFGKLAGIFQNSRELLNNTFSSKFTDAIKNRSLFIPESALSRGLAHRLSDSNIAVRGFHCTDDGINMELGVSKLAAVLNYNATLVIDAFEISSEKHEVIVRVTNVTLSGERLWGKVISGLIGTIFQDITSAAIEHTKLASSVVYDPTVGKAKLDLSSLSFVELLYHQAPILHNHRIVDYVNIQSIEHEEGGIRIKIDIPL